MAERIRGPDWGRWWGGVGSGLMMTGIIGPVTVMNSFVSQFGSQSSTVHGLIAGHLADKPGRPKGISIGALIFAIGATLEAAAVHIGMFVVGRCIEGIGEGLYLGALVVYICEISLPRVRGALTTGPQLLVTLGLTIGFFTCYGTSCMKSSCSWRTPFIILACLATTFSVASLLWLNPSPKWLTLHGRRAEATAVWDHLGISQAEQHKFFDLFSRDVRTRTVLAMFLMCMQQLSGLDGVHYHAPLLLEQVGLASSDASFFASGNSATIIFAVTIPALIWADRWGRRRSTIYGGTGLADAVYNSTGAGRWAVGTKIYAAEIQPQRTRASATSLAHGSNRAANFLVALTTHILLSKSSFGAYFLFGGCTLITAFICALFMPETKGRSLDEIEEAFISISLSKTLLKAFRPITQTAQR
ncbi:MFS general substrate transporter [Aspergillus eucalypticola CBS 122712]|uniref:MFS general substrate transporter n=1 Tax=Aspergillus eucalypticola (strain CBS 122712 / IBT 29274) TaxID=1448314 RepID=A0A317WIS6_ASPEC|nr:MFS general substrate transporter [Aspergillus eucalypticola CBS 122712]PWY85182.1 MFS general substrate transporter [Aspergillus eucalypticola CBS 122712]